MEVNFPADMAQRLESAARARGGTTGSLVILAVAEKLARIEHEQWLAQAQENPGPIAETST